MTEQRQATILILGGTGFVGRHLAAELSGRGYRLRLLTRYKPATRDLWVLPGLEVRQADMYDRDTLEHHLQGCQAAINLVGILNERGRSGKGFRRAHVELTDTLLQAMVNTGVRRYLHMSALNAGQGKSHYLNSKGEAEVRVQQAAARDGIEPSIFQPSVIFAPDDSFFNRFAGLLRLAPLGLPLACANSRFQPVWVGDVVRAFAVALQRPDTIGQTFQLGGPSQYRLRELVNLTAKWNGWRRRAIPIPRLLARLQALVFDFSPIKPFSSDNYHSLQIDSVVSGEDGLRQLGIEPRSVESIMPAYFAGEQLSNPDAA